MQNDIKARLEQARAEAVKKMQERIVYEEFPYWVYTFDDKIFYVHAAGSRKDDGFRTLAGAIESIKYQTT